MAYLPVFVGSRYLALFHSTSSTIWHVFCALSFLQAIYGLFASSTFTWLKENVSCFLKRSLIIMQLRFGTLKTFFVESSKVSSWTEIYHILLPGKTNLCICFCRKLLLSVVSLSEFCFFHILSREQEVDDHLNVFILGLFKRRLTI